MVYPKPEASPPQLPAGEPRALGAAAAARSQGSNEFDGIRAYRRGDPIKNVLWKKAAKVDSLVASNHSGLVVRDSLQAQNQELWLDIRQTGLPDLEARLSRLCAWVLLADRLGLDYGLRLSAGKISPGCGQAHQRRCLEALATC